MSPLAAVTLPALLAPLAAAQVGDFRAPLVTPLGSPGGAVALADVSGDGLLDVVVLHRDPSAASVLVQQGAGVLAAPVSTPLGVPLSAWPFELHWDLGDLDGDGRADLVLIDTAGDLHAWRATADGALLPSASLDLSELVSFDHHLNSPTVVEVNGDGRPDVAFFGTHELWVVRGDGQGGFNQVTGPLSPPSLEGVAPTGPILPADVTGDGITDLITGGAYVWGSCWMILAGDGAGGFSGHDAAPLSVDTSSHGLAYGDLDGDGHGDLAHLFTDYQIFFEASHAVVGLWTGGTIDASFPEDVVLFSNADMADPRIADVDGDGYGDLLAHVDGLGSGAILVHLSDGQGGLGPTIALTGVGAPQAYAVGPLDGFGADDLVLVDELTDSVVVLLNDALLPGTTDLGGALAGSLGAPALAGSGELVAGASVGLHVSGALPGASASLVLGLTELSAPFKGGVLVPSPDVILGGLPVDGAGAVGLAFTWPAGLPANATTWWQVWIADPGAPAGLAATNGLALKTGPGS